MTDVDLEFEKYVRTPFQVQVVRITKENIDKVAEMVGEVKVKNGEKYISLDRRIVPNVGRAFVDWYVTVLGDNLRCYAPKVFKEQFKKMPDDGTISFSFEDDDEDDPIITTDGDVEVPQPEANTSPVADLVQAMPTASTDVAEDPVQVDGPNMTNPYATDADVATATLD